MTSSRSIVAAFLMTISVAIHAAAENAGPHAALDRLTSMSPAEKERLRIQYERFERLPEAEQVKLRQLDSAIANDPQPNRLRQVMRSYSDWLSILPSSDRVELMSLPVEQRIERIKQVLEQQEQERFKELFGSKLQPSDQKVLLDWVHDLITQNEEQILQRLTPIERQRLQYIEDSTQRRVIMAMIFRWKSRDVRLFDLLHPTPDDLEQLSGQLSPLARDTLDAARNEKEREQLIQVWARAVIDSRARPAVSKEEMQHFLTNVITDEQRAYLESLPQDRMRMELQRLYMRHRFNGSQGPGPFRPGGPGSNPPNGRRGGIMRGGNPRQAVDQEKSG